MTWWHGHLMNMQHCHWQGCTLKLGVQLRLCSAFPVAGIRTSRTRGKEVWDLISQRTTSLTSQLRHKQRLIMQLSCRLALVDGIIWARVHLQLAWVPQQITNNWLDPHSRSPTLGWAISTTGQLSSSTDQGQIQAKSPPDPIQEHWPYKQTPEAYTIMTTEMWKA